MPKPRTPLVLSGRVADGEIHIDAPKFLKAALPKWEGVRITITIAPEVERRRERANKYYWAVVLKLMAEESGHTADDLHELMKLRHHSKVIAHPVTGEEVRIGQSTTTLSIADFSVYLEKVMLDGAEWLGLTFPPPRHDDDWRDRTEVA